MNFVINIIVIITTTLFKTLIAVIFGFKLIIVIVIVVIEVFVIVTLISERPILKLIAFDFNIKRRFTMNIGTSFDKSQNLIIVETFNNVFLKINNEILLF